MRSIQTVLVSVVLGLAATWATAAAATDGDEPLYKGKSLRAWIFAAKDDFSAFQDALKAAEVLGPKSEKAIPNLLELLKDDNSLVRSCVCKALEGIGDKGVAPLLAGLANETPMVRERCAEALGNMGTAAEKSAPALRRFLKDDSPQMRHEVAAALVALEREDKEVLTLLIEELKDEKMRGQAAFSLGQCGPPARGAVPALIDMLKDVNQYQRSVAVSALAGIGPVDPQVLPALIGMLKDESLQVRTAAVQALGEIGPAAKVTVPELILLTNDKNKRMRAAAIRSLGSIGREAKDAISVLTRFLTDEDPNNRAAAARSLGKIGHLSKTALATLQTACDDKDPGVRQAAAFSLCFIDGHRAGPVMREMLNDQGLEFRGNAAYALGRIRPVTVENVVALTEALDDKDPYVRDAATLAIAWVGPAAKAALPSLTKSLTSSDGNIRARAAGAVWRVGGEKEVALPVLLDCLRDKDSGVRARAAAAFREIGADAREAIPALTKCLKDPDDGVRINAAAALWRAGGTKELAQPVLLNALKSRKNQHTAVWLLGEIGPEAKDAIPALAALTQEGSKYVRKGAADALRKIDPKGSIDK